MISLWAVLTERDVEAYVGTLILPSYLAHLRLGPFRFAAQTANCDGRESLKIPYVGQGRVEEYELSPDEHALAMIRFAWPGIDARRIRLPRDDAAWAWSGCREPVPHVRVYFAPASQALGRSIPPPEPDEAYVSVSRGHVFLGRPVVQRYVTAWLERLGIDDAGLAFDFASPSGGIEFAGASVGGQMLLDAAAVAQDLMHFAGLDRAMSDVVDRVRLDLGSPDAGGEVCHEGVTLPLARSGAGGEAL